MKANLMLVAAAFAITGLAACSPNYPTPKAGDGLCRNANCKVTTGPNTVVSGEQFYSHFMAGVSGSCADPSTMSFTSMVATTALPKDGAGYAEIRLYLNKTGHYTGAYSEPVGAFGALNPATQGQRKLKKISGSFYLENDKIVIENVGIGHRNTDDEILLQPISSSPLSMMGTMLISFEAMQSDVNEKGQSVAEYCAAQAQTSPATPAQPQPADATTPATTPPGPTATPSMAATF